MKLDEMVFEGKEGRGVARGDPQFAIDGAQVRIDSAWTDDQDVGDLGIAESSHHQPQHFHLSLGQVARSRGGRHRLAVRTGRGVRVTGEHGVPLGGQRLLWRHRSPLGQGLGKGLLPKLGSDKDAHPLMISLLVRDDK